MVALGPDGAVHGIGRNEGLAAADAKRRGNDSGSGFWPAKNAEVRGFLSLGEIESPVGEADEAIREAGVLYISKARAEDAARFGRDEDSAPI